MADETEVLSQRGGLDVQVKLVVLDGPDAGLEAPLMRVVRIGSDAACQLRLSDAAVSREHAVVTAAGGAVAIRDLDSKNGTFVDSIKVQDAELRLGAVVRVGKTTLALQPRFHVREVAPSSAAAFGDLCGTSIEMRSAFAVLERVAPTDVTVLIDGESGTGKELAARAIHAASARRERPYVVYDCAAVPRELAESDLFGHVRGAFSGAVADRQGAFHRAHGGTICLDEIGELPIDLQPKLLRVLETGEVRRVGDDRMQRVDVRVVAATNRDLHAESRRGTFRADLLYRLDVVRVRMPPLRARPDDIALIASRLLAGKISDEVGGDNLARLMSYSWPGNVRELRNVLDRAVALAPKPARFAELVFNLAVTSPQPLTLGAAMPGVEDALGYKEAKSRLLAGFDRRYVESVLSRHAGNVTEAARAAGLSRRAFYDLMQRATGQAPDDTD